MALLPKFLLVSPAPGTSQVLLEFCHPRLLLIPAPLSPVVVNSLEFPSFWVHCRILKGIRTDPHHPAALLHPSIPNPVKNPGTGGKNLPGAAGRAGSAQFQGLGVTWGSGKGGAGWGLSFFQPKTSCGVGDPQGLSLQPFQGQFQTWFLYPQFLFALLTCPKFRFFLCPHKEPPLECEICTNPC